VVSSDSCKVKFPGRSSLHYHDTKILAATSFSVITVLQRGALLAWLSHNPQALTPTQQPRGQYYSLDYRIVELL
jgi:hypothetical protein